MMPRPAVIKVIGLLAVVIWLGAGCGDVFTSDEGDEDGVTPPPPTDIMGLIPSFADTGRTRIRIKWLTEESVDLPGCYVYRTDGTHRYERLNSEPVLPGSPGCYLYVDQEAEFPSDRKNIYCVTAMSEEGIESYPSPFVLVPENAMTGVVHGLSPGDGQMHVSVTPTFAWETVGGAESYCISVIDASTGDRPVIWQCRTTDTRLTFPTDQFITYVPFWGQRLDYDARYECVVFAIDENNFTSAAGRSSFTTLSADAVPAAPLDVMGAFREYEGGIALGVWWLVEDVSELHGCNVYRRIGGGSFVRINEEPVQALGIFHDPEVIGSPGQEISYYVTAIDLRGIESDRSPEVIVPADFVWAPVHNLLPRDGETDVPVRPTFSWDAVDGAQTYCIYIGEAGSPGDDLVWVYRNRGTIFECGETGGATYAPLDAGQLLHDASYSWGILAVSESNFAFAGGAAVFTTESGGVRPPAPTDIMGTLIDREGLLRMRIRWSVADAGGLLGCNVYRKVGSGVYAQINEGPVPPEGGYMDEDVGEQPNERLSYYATAVDWTGAESDPSAEVIVPANFVWTPVSNFLPSDGQTEVPLMPTFSWDAVSGAETYSVSVSESGAPGGDFLWVHRDTGTSFEFGQTGGVTYVAFDGGQLTPGAEYRWSIRGVNEDNFQFAGGQAIFTTITNGSAQDSR